MINPKSWREQLINLTGGVSKQVTFIDTKPTILQINNNSKTDTIYIGNVPSVNDQDNFIKSIVPMGLGIISRPTGYDSIFLYSPVDVTVNVNSGQGEISAQDLDRISQNIIVNGTITGALPTGNNHIGSVTLDNVNVSVTTQSEVEVNNSTGNPLPMRDVNLATTPTINDVTITLANTEYSYAIPNNTKKITASLKDYDSTALVEIYYTTLATKTMTILGSGIYSIDGILTTGLTLYVKSTVAGKTLQIETWQ